jgi:5-methylcytosine-specific restriction protein A
MASRIQTLKPRVQPLHKPARGWAETSTKSTTERGYGWAWQRLRERILERDCGLCQPCKAHGRLTVAHAVDHIVSKANGGTDAERNLQAICETCHKAKTAAERAGGGGVESLGA